MKNRLPQLLTLFGLTLAFFNQSANCQGLNLEREAEVYSQVLVKDSYRTPNNYELPEKIDLSDFVPSVMNQENLGTCVGVSSAYYARTILEAVRTGTTRQNDIDQLRFSPSFLYNAIKDKEDRECLYGTEIRSAMDFMKENGIASFASQGYPYCGTNKPLELPEESKLLDYIRLFDFNYRGEDVVEATQKALAELTPVVVGIETTPSLAEMTFWQRIWRKILRFFGIDKDEENEFALWKPSEATEMIGGHAVCLVGYDNNRFGGAFKAVNSWGDRWGDNGFFWIRYSDYPKYTKYAYQPYIRMAKGTSDIQLSADINLYFTSFMGEEEVPFDRIFHSKDNADPQSTNHLVAYQLREPQESGTQYRFSANIDKQSYLYLVSANATRLRTNVVFPFEGVSPIIGANTNVLLPREEGLLFQLDRRVGQEYWLFLFSETPLDIEKYVYDMNNGSGSFPDRVLSIFGEDLVPANQVMYKDKKIGFEIKGDYQGRIVPVMISVEHI